jgi:hypothetical protein
MCVSVCVGAVSESVYMCMHYVCVGCFSFAGSLVCMRISECVYMFASGQAPHRACACVCLLCMDVLCVLVSATFVSQAFASFAAASASGVFVRARAVV